MKAFAEWAPGNLFESFVPRDFATWSCMYFYHPTNK